MIGIGFERGQNPTELDLRFAGLCLMQKIRLNDQSFLFFDNRILSFKKFFRFSSHQGKSANVGSFLLLSRLGLYSFPSVLQTMFVECWVTPHVSNHFVYVSKNRHCSCVFRKISFFFFFCFNSFHLFCRTPFTVLTHHAVLQGIQCFLVPVSYSLVSYSREKRNRQLADPVLSMLNHFSNLFYITQENVSAGVDCSHVVVRT